MMSQHEQCSADRRTWLDASAGVSSVRYMFTKAASLYKRQLEAPEDGAKDPIRDPSVNGRPSVRADESERDGSEASDILEHRLFGQQVRSPCSAAPAS